MNEEKSTETTSGYGDSYGSKKNWVKWVIIYIIAAIVVYGLVYYVVKMRRGSGDSTGTTTSIYGQ